MENSSIYYLLLGAQHRRTISIERPFTPLHKVDTPLLPFLSLSHSSRLCVCVCVNNERPRAVFLLFLSSISKHKKLIILHHFYACVWGTRTHTHSYTHTHTYSLKNWVKFCHTHINNLLCRTQKVAAFAHKIVKLCVEQLKIISYY